MERDLLEQETYDELLRRAKERRAEIQQTLTYLHAEPKRLLHVVYASLAGLLLMGLWWQLTGSRPSQGVIEAWVIASVVGVGHQYVRVMIQPSLQAMAYLPHVFAVCEEVERDLAMARQQLAAVGRKIGNS